MQRRGLKKTTRGPRGEARGATKVFNLKGFSESEERTKPQSTEVEVEIPVRGVPMETEARVKGEGASSSQAKPTHRRGKEPTGKDESQPGIIEWPSPYYVVEIGTGAWNEMRSLMIGTSLSGPRYEKERDEEHQYHPYNHLDDRSSVLKSRFVQAKAMEQFWLPRDEEILKGIPDVGLHLILRSCLVRGCLVEHEINYRLAHAHDAYLKLQEMLEGQKTGEGADLEKTMKERSVKEVEIDDWCQEMKVKEEIIKKLKASDAQKSAKIQELKRTLHESDKKTRRVNEVLKERDLAVAQVAVEKQERKHAQAQLEEELVAKNKLQDECARLKESLCVANSRIAYLESDAHLLAIIEQYHLDVVGKVEVTIAYKAGYDYFVTQLPAELKDIPG